MKRISPKRLRRNLPEDNVVPTLTYYHLQAGNYPTAFPTALDAAPILKQKHTFIDGWIFNRMYSMMLSVQQYILDNKTNIEV